MPIYCSSDGLGNTAVHRCGSINTSALSHAYHFRLVGKVDIEISISVDSPWCGDKRCLEYIETLERQ